MKIIRDMTRTALIPLLLLAILARISVAQHGNWPEPMQFMPLSEVRAGMKGKSRTVFRGSEPEEFDVEILGVAPGMIGPQQDMIVCRISGGKADRTAVFAGMSGSPVVVEGKLVGSISFAFPFSKEPLCGITPIEQIIGNFTEAAPREPRSAGTFSFADLDADSPASLPRRGIGDGVISLGPGAPVQLSSAAGQTFRSIGIPLYFSGVSQRTIDLFAPQLAAAGLLPVAGAGGSSPMSRLVPATRDTLLGGDSISVQLARGDLSLAASGTVTLRDGDKVYAFGHPFLGLGGTELPMAESSVVEVVPSINNSFKIAVPGAMVGTLTQDRATGVFGKLGVSPSLIPVTVEMTGSRGVSKTFRFDVAKDEFLTPLLVNIGIANVILSSERSIGDMTIDVSGEIRLRGQQSIGVEKAVTGPVATQSASLAFALPVNVLLRSRFSGVEIEGLTVRLAMRDGSAAGTLERISVDRAEVVAGEAFVLETFVRRDGGSLVRERISVTVPAGTQPGPLTVTVADGGELQETAASVQYTPGTLAELVSLIVKAKKEDRLYVQLSKPSGGAVVGASEMPNLPPSVLATLGSARNAGSFKPLSQALVLEQELTRSGFVINGKQSVSLEVVRK